MMASFLHVLLGRRDLGLADLVRPGPLVLPSSSHFFSRSWSLMELLVSGAWDGLAELKIDGFVCMKYENCTVYLCGLKVDLGLLNTQVKFH